MRAVQATPKTIQKVFQEDKYVIPPFQRRYSWNEEESMKLFDDITDFLDEHTDDNDNYYLGNMVVYPGASKNSWVVVDGQQRLTTLLLLLRAIFSKAHTATALEECWKRRDPFTGRMINELKVESQVIEGDKNDLEAIILNGDNQGKGKLKQNYRRLEKALDDYFHGKEAKEIETFILRVLTGIVLLPIECDSQDDALIIFNTLNNRGLPLSDADIFKADLYQYTKGEKENNELITRWNSLENVNDLFRTWMHIVRAEEKITEKEIAQRKFFERKSVLLSDWRSALDILEGLSSWGYEGDIPLKTENMMYLLYDIPHVYCWYPISVFWHKHACLIDGEAILPSDKVGELDTLVTRTVKFYFLYAVAYNSVNRIKDATYHVNAAISHGEEYLPLYRKDYNEVYSDFKRKIEERRYGKSRTGLVSLLSVLNPKQDHDNLYELAKWEVEHILPRRGGYNNYNGWSEEQYMNEIDSLGNLVMLEKPLNIRASNEFFRKKCEIYKQSVIQDARDLTQYDDWTYTTYQKRHAERQSTLLDFFETMD